MESMKSILVVEDDKGLQMLFKIICKEHQLSIVDTSSNAIETLRLHNSADVPYDLVFLDYDLLDGDNTLPVAEFIAENHISCEVVVMTSNPQAAKVLKEIIGEDAEIMPKFELMQKIAEFV